MLQLFIPLESHSALEIPYMRMPSQVSAQYHSYSIGRIRQWNSKYGSLPILNRALRSKCCIISSSIKGTRSEIDKKWKCNSAIELNVLYNTISYQDLENCKTRNIYTIYERVARESWHRVL